VRSMIAVFAIVGLVAPVCSGRCAAEETPAANLLANGGFEEWQPAATGGDPRNTPQLPDGLPANWSVLQEAYERADDPQFGVQGTVARDTTVKHSGAGALRLVNGLRTDITEVSQGPFAVQPNSVYRVRCWVRGEGIAANSQDGCGVIVWGNTGPGAPGSSWARQTPLAKTPTTRTGTFDWQQFEFQVDTAPDTGWLRVALQLRRAGGTAWYDDVEVTRLGSVHPVESY